MIYFRVSKPHSLLELEDILKMIDNQLSVTFIDEVSGYFEMDEAKFNLLEILTKQLVTDSIFTLTMIEVLGNYDLALVCLNFIEDIKAGSFVSFLDCLILALFHQNDEVLKYYRQFFEALEGDSLAYVLEYCRLGGLVQLSADRMYVHRNTMRNHLQRFTDQTKLDLKREDIRSLIRILSVIVHGAQD